MEGSKMSQTEYDLKAIMYSAYDIPNKLYNISINLNIQQPRLPPNNAGRPNFNFGNKFSIIYLAKGEKRLDFDYLQTAACERWCLMQNIDMCLLYISHQIARLVSHLINHFSKWMFTVY